MFKCFNPMELVQKKPSDVAQCVLSLSLFTDVIFIKRKGTHERPSTGPGSVS